MKAKEIRNRFIHILRDGIQMDKKLFGLDVLLILIDFAIIVIGLLLPMYLLQALGELDVRKFFVWAVGANGLKLLLQLAKKSLSPYKDARMERFNSELYNKFLNKSMTFQLQYFEQEGAYDRYSLVFGKICQIYRGTRDSFLDIFYLILQLILTVSVLSWMNPAFLGLVCLVALIGTGLLNKMKKCNVEYQKKMVRHNRLLNYLYRLFYIPDFMRDIRVNSIFELIFNLKQTTTETIVGETLESKKYISKYGMLQESIYSIESIILTLYLGYKVICGDIWFDKFTVSLSSYSRLKAAISDLLATSSEIYENDFYIREYMKFMNEENTICYGERKIKKEEIETIEFKNVSFLYPNSTKYALKNINLKINKNDKIMIVGKNGAGKTTLIKLLTRLYEPESGVILINGVDIKEYDLACIRENFSVLFQDYSVYAFSIEDNLTLGKAENRDRQEVCLKTVNLWEKFMGMPLKLQTPISSQLYEKGIELSGGEKQRLAIARALIRDGAINIYDEPTSNVDSFMENTIFEEILSKENSIMIVISHQLSFAREMTKIIYIDNGHIIEEGTHEELMKKEKGLYSALYKENIKKYENVADERGKLAG